MLDYYTVHSCEKCGIDTSGIEDWFCELDGPYCPRCGGPMDETERRRLDMQVPDGLNFS
jgi:hypothetical protein